MITAKSMNKKWAVKIIIWIKLNSMRIAKKTFIYSGKNEGDYY